MISDQYYKVRVPLICSICSSQLHYLSLEFCVPIKDFSMDNLQFETFCVGLFNSTYAFLIQRRQAEIIWEREEGT